MKRALIILATLLIAPSFAAFQQAMPLGLMLALDFESVENGLIPTKTLYPLDVPVGELNIEWHNGRNVLVFPENSQLDIPHSALLDPRGEEWIVSTRAFCLTDGVVVSQFNDSHGFAICFQDEQFIAWVKTGDTVFKLEENPHRGRGVSKFRKKWVTVEIKIRDGAALLYLNRTLVAMAKGQPALSGSNMRIRVGTPSTAPSPFDDLPQTGFTGAINSFKITRQ